MEIKKLPVKDVFTVTELPQLSGRIKPDQKQIDSTYVCIDFTCPRCEQKLEFKEKISKMVEYDNTYYGIFNNTFYMWS